LMSSTATVAAQMGNNRGARSVRSSQTDNGQTNIPKRAVRRCVANMHAKKLNLDIGKQRKPAV